MEIVEMTLHDYEQIKNCLISDFDEFWTPTILKNEILGLNRQYFVVKENRSIVGFVGVMVNGSELELMNLVIKKTERKKGIGTFLLNKIVEFAKNKNIQTIFLEVSQNNEIAKKMYEKAGFCEIGIRKNYYQAKENAILMSKKVNNLQK